MKSLILNHPHYQNLFGDYLQFLEAMGYSHSTLIRGDYGVKEFLWYLEQHGILDLRLVTYDTMVKYLYRLKQRRNSRNTDKVISIFHQIRLINGVRSFFSFLVKTGQLSYNPASDVVIKRPKYLPRNIMNLEEISAVLNALETETIEGIRNRLILETLYGTGLRRSEVVHLEIQDVDMAEGTLCIREGKGKKDRYVAINPSLSEWFRRYFDESRTEYVIKSIKYKRGNQFINQAGRMKPVKPSALFMNYRGEPLGEQSIRDVVKKAYRQACKTMPSLLNKRISPHCFRHSIATHLLKKGEDIRKIQKFLGHASIESTEIYTRVDIDDLKKLAQNNHPREDMTDSSSIPSTPVKVVAV